jgi:hypothetical protein
MRGSAVYPSASNRKRSVAAAFGVRLRPFLTLLTLLSFLAQGYLVQTHIHGLPTAFASERATPAASQQPVAPVPDDNDQAACPLCQEFVQAGNYLTPAAIAVLPPAAVVQMIAVVAQPIIAVKPVSHSWRGRAPPHA